MGTFQWWKEQVISNPDSIIITVHHYVLRDTTVASGLWEGMERDEDIEAVDSPVYDKCPVSLIRCIVFVITLFIIVLLDRFVEGKKREPERSNPPLREDLPAPVLLVIFVFSGEPRRTGAQLCSTR